MRKFFASIVGCVLTMGTCASAQVSDFTLVEQNISLKIGESRQLHTNPADVNVRWVESWGLANNPVIIVDENGMVTALKAGKAHAVAESQNGNVRRQCLITVENEGSTIKEKKSFTPVEECEWMDVKFTLCNDGLFVAKGAYYGSGAQTNYLNYIVTDQCIFLWFDINYEDSTRMFYPQPFILEINDCNSQSYNIYYDNRTRTIQPTNNFVKYAITRGSSIGGTTNATKISIKRDDNVIYNLNGQEIQSIPTKGIYIKNGKKISK